MSSSSSNGGGKVSFFLTLQLTSPRLTCEMMESINLRVDEIVTSCDSALTYTYIHLVRKARREELEGGIRTLASTYGVIGSLIFGYEPISSSSLISSDLIEDHPGFKTLVQHEAIGNEHFTRWTAETYSGTNSGYNLLKSKLLARRTSRTTSVPPGVGGGSSDRIADNDDDVDEGYQQPESGSCGGRSDHDGGGRGKRQRAFSGGHSGYDVPESVPAYLVQFTANSIASSMSRTIGEQANEASTKLRRVEDKLDQQRRLIENEVARVAAAEREASDQRSVAEVLLAEVLELRRTQVAVRRAVWCMLSSELLCFLLCRSWLLLLRM
jgi:hypothetical protein